MKILNNLPSLQETKFAFFATATFQEGLCVGMKVNGTTKWLKIPKRINNQLFGIFSAGNSDVKLNIERSKWKSLINGSSMHVSTKKKYIANSITWQTMKYPFGSTLFLFSALYNFSHLEWMQYRQGRV